eukprot:gene5357-6500_t
MGPQWLNHEDIYANESASGQQLFRACLHSLLRPGKDTALVLTPHTLDVRNVLEEICCAPFFVQFRKDERELLEDLEWAYAAAEEAAGRSGGRCSALVLSTPCPMTGQVADCLVVGALLRWAATKPGLHFVVDETLGVGAFSDARIQFDTCEEHDSDDELAALQAAADLEASREWGRHWGRGRGFVSASAMLAPGDDRAHIIGAVDHDSCSSARGWDKCAAWLLSQNVSVQKKGGSEDSFMSMLEAEEGEYISRLCARNSVQMRTRQELTRRLLHEAPIATGTSNGIITVHSMAGSYVLCDLRRFLDSDGTAWNSSPDFEQELALFDELFEVHGVLLAPGALFGASEPGWFRMNVAWDEDALIDGIDRLSLALRWRNGTGRFLDSDGTAWTDNISMNFEQEPALFDEFFEQVRGVLLAPGALFGASESGWFIMNVAWDECIAQGGG